MHRGPYLSSVRWALKSSLLIVLCVLPRKEMEGVLQPSPVWRLDTERQSGLRWLPWKVSGGHTDDPLPGRQSFSSLPASLPWGSLGSRQGCKPVSSPFPAASCHFVFLSFPQRPSPAVGASNLLYPPGTSGSDSRDEAQWPEGHSPATRPVGGSCQPERKC